jgi:hypothetical protein
MLIPAVFLGHTARRDDARPTYVSRLVGAEKIRNLSFRWAPERCLNRSHRVNDTVLIINGQRIQQRLDTML